MRLAMTLDYGKYPDFAARARFMGFPVTHRRLEGLRRFVRILLVAWNERLLVLDNERMPRSHPELFATAVMGFWPRRWRPIVVLVGDMYQPRSGIRGMIERLVIRLADRAIHRYAVRSSDELYLFPQVWGIAKSKVRHCPYYFSIPDGDREVAASTTGGYVFAGGNSHRDYEPLLAAARNLPEYQFVLATTRLSNEAVVPPNVKAGPVPGHEFTNLLLSAEAVVVPLRRGLIRAAGQDVYLSAMWLGKATIVVEAPAVRDHIQDGETGIIVDGSSEGYERALRWVFDPVNRDAVARLCAAAQKVVRDQYTFENHAARLLEIVDEAIHDVTAIHAES